MTTVVPPSFDEVLAARERIAPYLRPTPLFEYPALGRRIGCTAYIKHENHQPVGAFKVRGGVNLVSQLSEDDKQRGLITASSGNHGQSIAYASRLFGVTARVCVPVDCNPVKRTAMIDLGAVLIEQGRDFDDARLHCEKLAEDHGYRYVHSGNEPALIAGVATVTLEIVEQLADVDVLIVPIGGGSGAAGACVVAKHLRPEIQVIGVQAAAAPSAYLTWRNKQPTDAGCGTFAEGLATRSPFSLPQRILQQHLDDFVLVEEDELRQAVRVCIEDVHNLAEGAGAAAIAAALKIRGHLQGKRVVMILSGGNLSMQQLCEILRE